MMIQSRNLAWWFTFSSLIHSQQTDAAFWKDSYILDYSYNPKSDVGPATWGNVDTSSSEWELYNSGNAIFALDTSANICDQQLRPSPINLFEDSSCNDQHEMLTRQINDTDCKQNHLTFELTPASLRAYYPTDDSSCIRPTIDPYGNPFILVWMEIHARAEHVIDGRRFDAELQMVHMGTGDTNSDMMTVSVLIDASAREDNAEFQWLLDQWQTVASADNTTCITNVTNTTTANRVRRRQVQATSAQTTKTADARAQNQAYTAHRGTQQTNCTADRFGRGCEPLGPRNRMYPYSLWPSIWYYAYSGSITSPPCSEINSWRIIDEPMLISRRQYKQLGSLMESPRGPKCESDAIRSSRGENFRPLQTMNQNYQSVSHCTISTFSFELYASENQ